MFAEHEASAPPFWPLHVHDHGPEPFTGLAVPALHRLLVGAVVKVCPFEEPHEPSTGGIFIK